MNINSKELRDIINSIRKADAYVIAEADRRMTSLAKPLKSLGKLEEIAIKLAGITGKVKNNITKKMVIIMSSDNGVVEEGVASAPQSVTLAQTINFTKGLTGVAVLAKENDTELMVIDVGITRGADASKKSGFAIKGDVDFKAVAPKSSFITPVPGGVGLMTIAALLKNTLMACRLRENEL